MKEVYLELLRQWCDALLAYQIHKPEESRLNGGILCPACQVIHGRCHEGAYPLLCMADITGEEKYREGALQLIKWGENLICDDGSFYNDAQSAWNGITVFGVIAICRILEYHGHLLDAAVKSQLEKRMERASVWIYRTITPEFVTNINYHASSAAALALAGFYLNREEFKRQAQRSFKLCMEHVSEDGFLYGEGHPANKKTKRGCRPVDIGYNVEESLPSLLLYARTMQDRDAEERVKQLLKDHLVFMLPDGGWDNSFGSRNFKWTYWGSRTSDGCQMAYGVWGMEEPVFLEAAERNLRLYQMCTHKGMLYGGPGYFEHGEAPCIHHTFCHAKALAEVLDYRRNEERAESAAGRIRKNLPVETSPELSYYPSIDTWRVSAADFYADITGYDFEYLEGGHTSGGTVSLLWNKQVGALLASSMTVYSLKEAHNMQLSRKKKEHQPLTMTVQMEDNEIIYAQCFDYDAKIRVEQRESAGDSKESEHGSVVVTVEAELKDMKHRPAQQPVTCSLTYEWKHETFYINGQLQGAGGRETQLVIPLICDNRDGMFQEKSCVKFPRKGWNSERMFTVSVNTKNTISMYEPVFFLPGGFEAWKICIIPDENGRFEAAVRVEERR